MSPYNFQKDYLTWKNYARHAHSRNFTKNDFYISSQSIVERFGHQKIARANCNRQKILEIGVGGGEHIEFEKGTVDLKNYTAVDIESSFLELVKKHYPEVNTVHISGCLLPFSESYFTTVIAASTLEHIPSLDDSLREIQRVLVPDGDFLVLVPRNGGLLIELFKGLVTYPTLRLNGIKRPSLIWHYENANSFKRIKVLLMKYFEILEEAPVPFSWLPSLLSPLHFFHCANKRTDAKQ